MFLTDFNDQTKLKNFLEATKELYMDMKKSDPEKIERAGQTALDALAGDPLYASTSGVTYEEAILIYLILNC